MKKGKKNKFSKFFYTIGTLIFIAMVFISVLNFVQDARIFQKPLLSTMDNTVKNKGNADDYKTIKYKKPKTNTKTKQNKDTTKNNAGTAKTETTVIPVSEP